MVKIVLIVPKYFQKFRFIFCMYIAPKDNIYEMYVDVRNMRSNWRKDEEQVERKRFGLRR